MLPLNDPRWSTYLGGYRVPYDASVDLRRLFLGDPPEPIWEEFWNELHHQGDVHQASYAAVPWLIEFVRRGSKLDGNLIRLIATIELQRDQLKNPAVAPELANGYFLAIRSLPEVLGTILIATGTNMSSVQRSRASHSRVDNVGSLGPASNWTAKQPVDGSAKNSAGISRTPSNSAMLRVP